MCLLRCVHADKNLVVRLGTTWLCDIKRVVVVWTVWATCVVQHFMLCDQDCELPNVGPLQKKFVRHNGLTKMWAIWRNLNIFLSFFTLQSRKIYKKNRGCVDVGHTTTFCMTTARFMSHMIKLLSVWTHLCTSIKFWKHRRWFSWESYQRSIFFHYLVQGKLSQDKIVDFELKHLCCNFRLSGCWC